MDTFVSGGKSCPCMEAPENLASGNLSFINYGELCGKRVTYLTEHLLFTRTVLGTGSTRKYGHSTAIQKFMMWLEIM